MEHRDDSRDFTLTAEVLVSVDIAEDHPSAKEEYIEDHKLRSLTSQWIDQIAQDQPVSPWEELIKRINEHVESQKQYLTCENPWCEAKIPLADYSQHLAICSPQRWHKCIRCNQRVDNDKMAQHRANCNLVICEHCGEYVFPRMLPLCPKIVLEDETPLGRTIDDEEALGKKGSARTNTWSPQDANIKQLQGLWRTFNARRQFHNLAFRLVWDRIEFSREMKLAKPDLEEKNAGLTVRRPSYSAKALRSFIGQPSPLGSKKSGFGAEALESMQREVMRRHSHEDYLDLLRLVERGSVVPFDQAETIVKDACKILRLRPVVSRIETPFEGETIVVGDLHGQLKDLLHILNSEGVPSENKKYLFNGDFVDRGPNGCEVLLIIFAMVCAFPDYVFLNRGNHEDRSTNREYGFLVEVETKYDEDDGDLFEEICKAYKSMPLVHIVDERIMVVHGGLPRKVMPVDQMMSVGHIADIPTMEQQDEYDELLVDLLWSDPVETFKSRSLGLRNVGKTWRTSSRGCGVEYTVQHTEAFLQANNLELVVRSHEMVAGGYQVMHDGKSVTVFSASDYCGVSNNRGAILVFSHHLTGPQYRTWYLKDIPFQSFTGDSPGLQRLADAVVPGAEFSPSLSAALSAEREDCLSQLREMIYNNRFQLMSGFCAADTSQVGYVSKVEWSEIMRRVTFLPLPWYFLCPFLADIVLFQEIPAVKYTKFLCSIETICGSKYKNAWIREKVSAVFSDVDVPDDFLAAMQRGNKRRAKSFTDFKPSQVSSKFSNEALCDPGPKVDFCEFTGTLRAKSKTAARLPDDEIFLLFTYFDQDRDGHILLDELCDCVDGICAQVDESETVDVVESCAALSTKAKSTQGWMFHCMMQLQQLFLFGQRRGLEATFRVLDKDRNGTLELDEFKRLLHRLNRQLQNPLTEEQMEEIFLVVDIDGSGGVDINEFTSYFSIRDLRDSMQSALPFPERKKQEVSKAREMRVVG